MRRTNFRIAVLLTVCSLVLAARAMLPALRRPEQLASQSARWAALIPVEAVLRLEFLLGGLLLGLVGVVQLFFLLRGARWSLPLALFCWIAFFLCDTRAEPAQSVWRAASLALPGLAGACIALGVSTAASRRRGAVLAGALSGVAIASSTGHMGGYSNGYSGWVCAFAGATAALGFLWAHAVREYFSCTARVLSGRFGRRALSVRFFVALALLQVAALALSGFSGAGWVVTMPLVTPAVALRGISGWLAQARGGGEQIFPYQDALEWRDLSVRARLFLGILAQDLTVAAAVAALLALREPENKLRRYTALCLWVLYLSPGLWLVWALFR